MNYRLVAQLGEYVNCGRTTAVERIREDFITWNVYTEEITESTHHLVLPCDFLDFREPPSPSTFRFFALTSSLLVSFVFGGWVDTDISTSTLSPLVTTSVLANDPKGTKRCVSASIG